MREINGNQFELIGINLAPFKCFSIIFYCVKNAQKCQSMSEYERQLYAIVLDCMRASKLDGIKVVCFGQLWQPNYTRIYTRTQTTG